MLEAARASVRFYCPECGAGLRALRADAGSVLDCEQCGEHVRIPRHPHPLESEAEDAPVISVSAAVTARMGLRLHLLSLGVVLAEYSLLLALGIYWAFARESGDFQYLFASVLALDLVLVTVRSCLRWASYRLCEPAAGAVRAGGWVVAARIAVGLRAVGYAAACLPLVLGPTTDRPPLLLTAAAETGLLVWLCGRALEFAILIAWHRILVEVGGREVGRRVTRFAIALGLSVIGFSCGILLLRAFVVSAMIRAGRPAVQPGSRLNLAVIPDEVWPTVAGFAAIATTVGLVLCWHYARIVLTVRAHLAGNTVR